MNEDDIVFRLRKRAEIRRQIPNRKSVQEGKPDRIADILEEAAKEIEQLRETLNSDGEILRSHREKLNKALGQDHPDSCSSVDAAVEELERLYGTDK